MRKSAIAQIASTSFTRLASPTGLNPYYCRESTVSWRKLLKLRNTDGCQKRFQ